MKVILIKQVPKVGKPGDVVEVSDGYAANSLFPNKSAIAATTKNLEALSRKKASEADLKAFHHGLLQQAINALPGSSVEISVRANEKGHLFSKIDEESIVQSLLKYRISISPKNILLQSPIKELGTYQVTLREGDYKAEITVVVNRQ